MKNSQREDPAVERLFNKIKSTLQQKRQLELFYKAFLQPIEIILKTQNSPNSMANGIKQVQKTSIDENKYTLVNFQPLQQVMIQDLPKKFKKNSQEYDINIIKQKNCDNLISLLKPIRTDQFGLKIAICVCMYSEDKSMLKRTLSGISENIKIFNKNGIASNQIGVFVFMDGIEVVHKSVEQYFSELEKQNNIYLCDDVDQTELRELMDNDRQMQNEQIDNINHLVFSDSQFEDRKKRRFSQRKRQYIMHKKMKSDIQKMEKDKTITYDVLDATIQRFFLEQARQQWKIDYGSCDIEIQSVTKEQLLQKYATNIRTSYPMIRKALNEGKKYCEEYITTRDNLALLNSFRVPITRANNVQGGRQSLNEEEEDDNNTIQMNLFMITKYKNRGKLSSHNWFFNGFCEELKPQYAVLLDVGISPQKKSLWRMYNCMQKNPKVGGVCGYMGLKIERLEEGEQVKDQSIDCVTSLVMKVVDIQRAQQFEYHFAHLIDKPFEAWFNFIHVLPGAFSAYRIDSIKKNQSILLKQYFKSIDVAANSTSYKVYKYTPFQTGCRVVFPEILYQCIYGKPPKDSFESLLYDENVYLAQDRTLCMGIYQNGFDLTYLPNATAWVDPIKTLYGLLGQRKRWINGSYFAFEKVKQTLEDDSSGEKSHRNGCLLQIQMIFLTVIGILGYISPALFMFTVHIAMYTFQVNAIFPIFNAVGLIRGEQDAKNPAVGIFVYITDFIYVMLLLGLVFYSMHLTNRQAKFKSYFYGVSTVFGLFSVSVFGVLLFDIISGFSETKNKFLIENKWLVEQLGLSLINSLRYVMISIIVLYICPMIIFSIFGHMDFIIDILFSTISFIFYSPTYHNILNIYALCRIDDISWGTKGIDSAISSHKKQILEDWKKIRLIHVSKFVLYNSIVAFFLLLFGNDYIVRFWITFVIMIALVVTLGLKVAIGCWYLVKYRLQIEQPKINENRLDDNVQLQFQKVKKSIYTGIFQSIKQKEEQTKRAGGDDKMVQRAIFSSKIYNKLRFGKSVRTPEDKKKIRIEQSKIQKYQNQVEKLQYKEPKSQKKETSVNSEALNNNDRGQDTKKLLHQKKDQKPKLNNLDYKTKQKGSKPNNNYQSQQTKRNQNPNQSQDQIKCNRSPSPRKNQSSNTTNQNQNKNNPQKDSRPTHIDQQNNNRIKQGIQQNGNNNVNQQNGNNERPNKKQQNFMQNTPNSNNFYANINYSNNKKQNGKSSVYRSTKDII